MSIGVVAVTVVAGWVMLERGLSENSVKALLVISPAQIASELSIEQQAKVRAILGRDAGVDVPAGCTPTQIRLTEGRDKILCVRFQCDGSSREAILEHTAGWSESGLNVGYEALLDSSFGGDSVLSEVQPPMFRALRKVDAQAQECFAVYILFDEDDNSAEHVLFVWFEPCATLEPDVYALFSRD